MVRVTFYPHQQTQSQEDNSLTAREEAIRDLFGKEDQLSFREIFQRLSIKISERTLRYDLAQLKKKGILISKGKGRSAIWKKIN